MVEVSIIYETLNPRGLPVSVPNSFQISYEGLLSQPKSKRPIASNRLLGLD